ncbi:hypothetical protein RND81_12G199800 [Saponaria officinalis]|uniref:THH1/TOM1/TOM3 domain-containing protein n=1 Tax=Saponaria officinalis TaxID=3572 RepID=A0AAW1HD05_SAPOF
MASIGITISELMFKLNESTQWIDVIFYTLSAAYSLLSAVALIQLIRIHLRVPQHGWTTQKVFHLMNFIFTGVRAAIFGSNVFVFVLRPKVLTLVLLHLPVLFFFTTYTLLILFWAEIYYRAKGLSTNGLRVWYILVNCAVYVIQILIWLYLWLTDDNFDGLISQLFIAVISFIAALGFLLQGRRLFLLLKRFPLESKGRQKKLFEVGSVTAICVTCFLIRCFIGVVSTFTADASLKVLEHPLLDLMCYMLTEIMPSALVLYILRKLPPKREVARIG